MVVDFPQFSFCIPVRALELLECSFYMQRGLSAAELGQAAGVGLTTAACQAGAAPAD